MDERLEIEFIEKTALWKFINPAEALLIASGINSHDVIAKYKRKLEDINRELEEYLKSKNLIREGRPIFWKNFVAIAFRYGIDHRKPELKVAAENIVKKHKFRWVPNNEPPE